MLSGRHTSRLDQIRRRFDRRADRPSRSLVEAESRLSAAVDRHFAAHGVERDVSERLTRAFDLIPQGVILADADGVVGFRNRAASGFVDARHGEALVEGAITELIGRAVGGVSETRTLELYGPPRRAVQLRAGPLRGDAGGDRDDRPVVGAFVLVEDVSDRQRLEAVRRDFVANISHELKTPIGALGVLAESLAGEDDPAVVARLADRMQREAFRVAHTIDDLLQLSRIETDSLPDPEPVDVASVVAEAIDRTVPAAVLRRVQVRAPRVESGLVVQGDRLQLVSALVNLLDNAVKYSDPGTDAIVEVAAARRDGWVAISVTDHGMGIPGRDLERIFERFYRVDRARSRETGGTGLGLAIVRHVVSNHDGEVTVTSREGEGTTFVLRFPDGAAVGPTPRSHPLPPAGTSTAGVPAGSAQEHP